MKRLISHITLAVLAIFVLGSCSKNNGDIGYWFGLWHLDSIEVNGEVDNNYDGNYYFLFQGKVFCVRYVYEGNHENIDAFAEWKESDDKKYVTINFIDDRYSPNFGSDAPNNYLSTMNTLKVDTLTSSTMVLSHTLDDGTTVTYRLTLWE